MTRQKRRAPKRSKGKGWAVTVGDGLFAVWVGERADKGGVVYLRFVPGVGRPRQWKSLGFKLPAETEARDTAMAEAKRQAELQSAVLKNDPTAAPAATASAPALTLGSAWAILTHPHTGPYPHETPYRNELQRALSDAVRLLGSDQTFTTLGPDEYRALGRKRVLELLDARDRDGALLIGTKKAGVRQRVRVTTGLRAAEITVQRVVTIAVRLRDAGKIPPGAGLPASSWKRELREFVAGELKKRNTPVQSLEPARPRYSWEESLQLIDRAWTIDPRLGLAVALGAEMRIGQVVRSMRSDLRLAAGSAGQFQVHGRGKKGGNIVHLTEGQRTAVDAALTGYLAPWEARYQRGELTDYPLFPAGQLTGGRLARDGKGVVPTVRDAQLRARPVGLGTLDRWWDLLEQACGIAHVAGRAKYGLKRAAIDEAKKRRPSREGLAAIGGWSDTQVADRIYADQEMEYARDEAAQLRAAMRGEGTATPLPTTTTTTTTETR